MLENTIIIILVIVIIYLYYQQSKKKFIKNLEKIDQTLMNLLNVRSLEELKTKLGEKNLDEIIEQNQDWETEVDNLTRTKNSLEADLTAQSNAFQSRLREKDRELKKAKEDLKVLEKVREQLTSEKQQHKGSLERIKLLTEQIQNLEKEKTKLLRESSKHSDLDDFQTWLNEEEERQANLPDWDKIITEVKDKIRDYHLSESNWPSGLLKRNGKYYQVFKEWIDSNHD